jgi:hypothetical protein
MADVDLAKVIDGIHGRIGDLVFRKQWGQQRVIGLPDYSGRPLPAQLEAQKSRMTSASRYWKGVKEREPLVKAAYEARAKALNKPVFAVVYGDVCQPPCVQEIDLGAFSGRAGQVISVRAGDDFAVREVLVVIRAAGGTVLESGVAAKRESTRDWWSYETKIDLESTAGSTVEAVAVDGPGNRDSRVQLVPSDG